MPNGEKILDFHRLKIITVIQGTLVNETPLRVGVGREAPLTAPVDLAVIRMQRVDGEVVPYIPGSSLKGVFRSFVERLASSDNTDPPIHEPWDFGRMEQEAKNDKFCVVCGIFGSTEVASHIRIYDALPEAGYRFATKTGVGIDREFGGAKPGILYTEEFVAPGCRWKFRMDLYNIRLDDDSDERTKYLKELFKALTTLGLQVGARKSVGMGLLRLLESTYTVYALENGVLKQVAQGRLAGHGESEASPRSQGK